jgi:hypothetical protein
MKKTLSVSITAALGLVAAMAATSASATTLAITAGTHTCVVGPDASQANGCSFGAAATSGGSYFTMGGNFANSMSSNVGLNVGVGTAQTLQGTAGSSGSPLDPNPATNPGIDQNITAPWAFFDAALYGVNFSVADIILTDTGVGTADADMSGWRVAWGEVPSIDMGQGDAGAFTYDGSNWTLDYAAVVPSGDPSGFGGNAYTVHLEGTYTGEIEIAPPAVPVPAAVWLFGSGLLGLVGVARRKKASV